jgi:hypothetical protein
MGKTGERIENSLFVHDANFHEDLVHAFRGFGVALHKTGPCLIAPIGALL